MSKFVLHLSVKP